MLRYSRSLCNLAGARFVACLIPEWWSASSWNTRPDNLGIRPLSQPEIKKAKLKREAQWRAITEIDRGTVKKFLELLQRLPSNATKHFPNATIFEAVEREKKLPVLAPHTANDYLRTLGGLFRYAVREGYLAIGTLRYDPRQPLVVEVQTAASRSVDVRRR